MSRTWMVTGTSTGFGRELAVAALDAGDAVVATARDVATLEGLDEGRSGALLALPLDVTDPGSVADAVHRAEEWAGGIDVLVNNAGHGLVGAFEELSDAQFRAVLEVNLHGVATVTRAVLPGMRRRGHGHVVQMSSVGGVVPNPGHVAYATSKFALEGFSGALAAEVAPFGIRVTIVEPGPFRTDFAGRSMSFTDAMPEYAGTPAGTVRERFSAQDGVQPGDPRRAAAAIRAAVDAPDAPLRLPLGANAVDRIRAALTARLTELDVVDAAARAADHPS